MSGQPDTICALATPVGTAAIALIRISGPAAGPIAAALDGRPPLPRASRHVDYRSQHGQLLDDVLATYFPGPHSYTGEDVLELSGHGNPFIVQRILEDLVDRGCRLAGPGEFTQRAFLNGCMDLSQAEAVMDLIRAQGDRALEAANRQLRGALGRLLNPMIDRLLATLARVEAYIDFPEEDLPVEDENRVRAEIAKLQKETERLLATSHYGEVLREGIRTLIVGAPNAGKSSLLNRLLGRERALVSAEPGTTRDFLEERVLIGPYSLRLIDTAGLNATPEAVERLGIAKTLECAADADLFLVVLDGTTPYPTLVPEVANRLRPENTIMVINKQDLVNDTPVPRIPDGMTTVAISALQGTGLELLQDALIRLAEGMQMVVGEEAVTVSARHARALIAASTHLGEAERLLAEKAPSELLASELRGALDAYGEISGRIDNERMLDELFATFCIGK